MPSRNKNTDIDGDETIIRWKDIVKRHKKRVCVYFLTVLINKSFFFVLQTIQMSLESLNIKQ
jgi:hypothetical protein